MKDVIVFLLTLVAWYGVFMAFVWFILKLFFPLYTKEEIEHRKAQFYSKQMFKISRERRRMMHHLVVKNH